MSHPCFINVGFRHISLITKSYFLTRTVLKMRVLFPINTKLNVNQLNLEVEVPQKIPKVGKMLVMKKKRTLEELCTKYLKT